MRKSLNPRVSGLFATTEQTLAPYFGEAQRSGGIFSRVWWIKADFEKDMLRFSDSDSETEYWEAIDAWTGWFAMMGTHEDKTIAMSPEADQLLKETLFADAVKHSHSADDLNPVRIRIVEKARVLAAIFAVMGGRTTVSGADMEHAVSLGRILLSHSRSVTMLGAPETARMVIKAEKLIQAAGRTGMTRRQLYPRLRCDKKHMDIVLETLADKQTVREDKSGQHPHYVHIEHLSAEEVQGSTAKVGKVISITPDASSESAE